MENCKGSMYIGYVALEGGFFFSWFELQYILQLDMWRHDVYTVSGSRTSLLIFACSHFSMLFMILGMSRHSVGKRGMHVGTAS